MSTGKGEKKELNFELDLLPVISMMSVCICFLLLTAVWTQIGSVNIEQGLGQESTRADQKAASLWIMMKAGGEVKLKMMDSPTVPATLQEKNFVLGSSGGGWNAIEQHAARLKQAMPTLKTALIMPDGRVNYGDVVRVMDSLKSLNIGEIGIAPL
jgi:biopolymer transport protein TolR